MLVAGSGQVQLEDRKNLAYVKAVIHETQRLANILKFCSLTCQQGSTVFPLLTSVLYDETEWENPHSFHPAHFLDTEGRFVKRDAFMPFSAGRRSCLVEALARMELFMFFSTLLQNFRFTPEPGVSEEDLDLTASQSPQTMCCTTLKRHALLNSSLSLFFFCVTLTLGFFFFFRLT
uniref:Uncharacterized protein n=1 Tax=Cynoglossus semilaevis TaxID=244447 RepID=A0A3P8V0L4_CYNSE